ncbi:hypothetical protein [Gloeocapsa sp. PCC 73106]|uniref:hypothetical protein n=1 Tax=Gloeocapsa sp. PCC 73106 TaxID=102232 RepID=UPI0002ABECE3|nr:hypothetical protein [Gloeocapsa sp. PCC 73106]ELR99954.1 hypothetical protein GLO73106DRAFT_00038070 [Gloeocapsa sp. PCC 73106]
MNTKLLRTLGFGLFLTTIVFMSTIFVVQPSYAGIAEDLIGKASTNFIESVLTKYQKEAQSSFDNDLASVNKTVDSLSALLDKATKKPGSVSEKELSRAIDSSQNKLKELASNFNTLADKTDEFDKKLETSVEDLLASVKGDVRGKFQESEKAYKSVASTLGQIVDNAGRIDSTNLLDIAGELNKDFKNLKTASGIVSQAFKAFAS